MPIELIDLHFTGALPRMYKVMIAALGAQYGDFLAEGGIVENIKSAIKIIQKTDNIELVQKILAVQQDALELFDKNILFCPVA